MALWPLNQPGTAVQEAVHAGFLELRRDRSAIGIQAAAIDHLPGPGVGGPARSMYHTESHYGVPLCRRGVAIEFIDENVLRKPEWVLRGMYAQ
jgi:hypothetical protein